jgi:hypothetical protein
MKSDCTDPRRLDTEINEVSYVQKGKCDEKPTKVYSDVQESGCAAGVKRGTDGGRDLP